MSPHDALDEIARLLELELASPYKARAFRRADEAIADLTEADIAARLADGRLARTPGIGASTLRVIRQAASGAVPDYLAELRERVGIGVEPVGLRALLRGDLHCHSDWSDGTTPIEAMAAAARDQGLAYLACTDHSPRLTVANGLSPERLREQLAEIGRLNASGPGVRLLTGIEVDILDDGALDQERALLESLDVVVASVHSKLRMERAPMTRRMIAAVRDPRTNVLGHCTGRLVQGSRGTRPPSEFDAEAVFAACADNGVAVEINARPERQDPPDELIALALASGCLFSIDSDAHAPGHLGFLGLGCRRAEAAGIPAERVVNTWPVERLLDWARPQ